MNGVLVIDKPAGMTSHDVVNRIRHSLNEKSVGHLGTLDPMATGVLPLVLGKLTRLAQFYTGSEKTYEGEIRFGFATDTYDAKGEATSELTDSLPSRDQIVAAAVQFHGVMQQVPPPFSAKKIAGTPAYKLARKDKPVDLRAVEIEIKRFEILSYENGRASFVSQVSSGTYIRSIAHDLGQSLGCGAHLSRLRRTSSAEFELADARTLEEIEGAAGTNKLQDLFVHPRRLLPGLPAVTATEETAAMIRNGRAVNLPELSRARQVKVFRGQRELIAIASRIAGTLFQPKVVFPTD